MMSGQSSELEPSIDPASSPLDPLHRNSLTIPNQSNPSNLGNLGYSSSWIEPSDLQPQLLSDQDCRDVSLLQQDKFPLSDSQREGGEFSGFLPSRIPVYAANEPLLQLDEVARALKLNTIALEEKVKAGLRILAQQSPSMLQISTSAEEDNAAQSEPHAHKILLLQNSNQNSGSSLPDIRLNNIRIKQFLYTTACAANAQVLGLSFEFEDCDTVESLFFRESISKEVAAVACSTDFQHLKTDLRPSPIQLIHRHHPWIDVLPFPTFRERVIKLAYSDPPMIDEDELCLDLLNDGLICWGSSMGGGNRTTGSGAPWDPRSWEAQSWFMKKWWIVIGGVEGEIYKQTEWWCELRGDRSCYPW
jgi:hypothetical protein